MKIDYQKEKIFLFGDSFTFGLGVIYENSFAGILDENFLKYQFFNFAVPSYSPSLYSYQLKQAINEAVALGKPAVLDVSIDGRL